MIPREIRASGCILLCVFKGPASLKVTLGASNDKECVLSSAIAEEPFSEQALSRRYKLTHSEGSSGSKADKLGGRCSVAALIVPPSSHSQRDKDVSSPQETQLCLSIQSTFFTSTPEATWISLPNASCSGTAAMLQTHSLLGHEIASVFGPSFIA